MSLFQNQYRIASTRLKDWDYTQAGWYFVTICAADRRCHFGRVTDGHVQLSSIGQIVEKEWLRAPEVRPNVALDAHVVMPNHLHGIIVIRHDAPAQSIDTPHKVSLKPGSLGAIVGQVKSICKKRIKAAGTSYFDWQRRFYDHIIRDDEGLSRIRNYIATNPKQW